MKEADQENLKRIKASLRKGSIQRNGTTALFVGIAFSGALIGTPWLIASVSLTSLILLAWKYKKE